MRRHHLRHRLIAVAVVALGANLLAWSPAHADNEIVMTRPVPGERLDARPDAVTVALTEPASKNARLVVEDSKGNEVSLEPARVVSTNISVQLSSDLSPGIYTVIFRTDTSRGPEGGSFQFAFASSADMSISGVDRWRGYEEVPDQVSEPGDDSARSKKSNPPGSEASPSPSTTATIPTAEPTSTAAPDDPDDDDAAAHHGDGFNPWWLLLPTVALGALAAYFVLRNRRDSSR